MNKYVVTDNASGRILEIYFAEVPVEARLFWGVPEHEIQATDPDGAPLFEADGKTPVLTTIAATYTVTSTDVTGTPEDPRMQVLRTQRDILLTASDWTQLPDSPLGSDQRAAWVSYRQTLRALPDQPGLDPASPTWPIAPS